MIVEYKGGDYCKARKCYAYKFLEKGNKRICEEICEAYKFHNWLKENGYKITIEGDSIE